MSKTDGVSLLIANPSCRNCVRALLGAAGIKSASFERTQDLASALTKGRTFDMMILSFEGDLENARSEFHALRSLFDSKIPILLLMEAEQVELAYSVMSDINHDYLLAPYTDFEVYKRAHQLYMTKIFSHLAA